MDTSTSAAVIPPMYVGPVLTYRALLGSLDSSCMEWHEYAVLSMCPRVVIPALCCIMSLQHIYHMNRMHTPHLFYSSDALA